MRRMLAAWLAGVLVVTLAVVAAGDVDARRRPAAARNRQPAVGWVDRRKLQRWLHGVVRAGAPGALALVRDGQGTWQGADGVADTASRRPLRPGDRFRAGSITKSFVATVVLQLVGEGRLRLADPVERWLPGLVPNGRHITIRELLDHTSGLYDYVDDLLQPPDGGSARTVLHRLRVHTFTPQALVAMATRHAPRAAPGAHFSYASTNYILLGLIVQQVTGTALQVQLRRRIFGPLGLRSTELPTARRPPDLPEAHGYQPASYDDLPRIAGRRLLDATEQDMSWAWSAGAIVSSAQDLARFYQALLGGKLLRPELLRAMETTVDAGAGVGAGARYGLGLSMLRLPCGVGVWGHSGAVPGYATLALSSASADRQVVLMVNLHPAPEVSVGSAGLDVAAVALGC